MAYDRYDPRSGSRDERWRDSDRFEARDRHRGERGEWLGGRDEGHHRGREERGFFERAGEQIASWFGDDDDRDHRRGREEYRERSRSQRPFGWGGDPRREDHQRDQDRSGWLGGRERERERGRDAYGSRDDDDRYTRQPSWHSSERDYNPSWRQEAYRGSDRSGRDRDDERGYRPMTGDYARSEQMFSASGYGRGSDMRRSDMRSQGERDYGRSDSDFGRDPYRRTSFAGSSERSNHSDPQYHEWRRRQMDELDRDYDDYRREHQSKFESEFGGWREKRQTKRQMLAQVREHMEVVGNDNEHVGTIDRVAGDRLILTKSDPEAGGAHHSLSCHEIDRIEGDRVILNCNATEARVRWRNESRDRALFEREDQGEAGPHMLDRSFSGTYR